MEQSLFHPMYFKTHLVPPCAKFEADIIIENSDPKLTPDEIADIEKSWPRGEVVTPGKYGYAIKQEYSIITILSTDPEACLLIDGRGYRYYLIGKGLFSFPARACTFPKLRLFHEGQVTVEYRNVSRDLDYALEEIPFNIIMHDRDGFRVITVVKHGSLHVIDSPDEPEFFPLDGMDTIDRLIGRVNMSLKEGLLHYSPCEGEIGREEQNQWDFEALRKDAQFLAYAYVGNQIHSIFVSIDKCDIDVMNHVSTLIPTITLVKRVPITDETWSFVVKHYDDDFDIETTDKDEQKTLFEKGGIVVYLPKAYGIRWG